MCARTCVYATSPSPSPSRCVRAHARMRASCTCVCVRSEPGERERYGALSPCTYARTHGRTRTYVPRRPPPLAARARTRVCARVVRTYACVPSPEKERDMVPSRHARTRVRTDVYVRTYVCLSGSRDAPPSPEGDPVSVLSTKFLRTYVRIQSALAHWDGLSVRTCHCACHVRGAFRQALGGFNSGTAQ